MSKKSIVNGVTVKVENRSGFDKSFFNALTTGVGTLTPLVKQLVIPNSDVSMRLKISAQLPPLASDAFLRSHLKVEAFWTPLRLCYGGFESWFCGKETYDPVSNAFVRAQLPNFCAPDYYDISDSLSATRPLNPVKKYYGAGSLLDYLGVYFNIDSGSPESAASSSASRSTLFVDKRIGATGTPIEVSAPLFNIFPAICYGLIYDEYYRNKLIERPLFSPPSVRSVQGVGSEATDLRTFNLPYVSFGETMSVIAGYHHETSGNDNAHFFFNFDMAQTMDALDDSLLNGSLFDLRQRNYGDDYFTAATPSAQEGSPVEVAVNSNKFTISALRLSNALQEFAEVNNYASPDYIQTLSARYGASLKQGIAQKPVYLGSADFPMYTSPVEQTSQPSSQVSTNNPFSAVGARYGNAHAEGSDFVCKFHADEPGYFMVIVSLVPEAQYFQGNQKDMMMLNTSSLPDFPCGLLEHIGNEPIISPELRSSGENTTIFGYVQRYLAHKVGNLNQVHGLFRRNESLGSFVVQRGFSTIPQINSSFLKVQTTDLDNVFAVSTQASSFGVMIDSAVDLFVSEPLSESAIPALSNPAREHGREVYVKTGGSKLA